MKYPLLPLLFISYCISDIFAKMIDLGADHRGCRLETKSFIAIIIGVECSATAQQPTTLHLHSPVTHGDRYIVNNEKGYGLFQLQIFHKSAFESTVGPPARKSPVWLTVPGRPFIYSAIGNDSLGPGNGEYRILQNNRMYTTGQSIEGFRSLVNGGQEIELTGQLFSTDNKQQQQQQQVAVLDYTMRLRELPNDDSSMEFDIQIRPRTEDGALYDRIILAYWMDRGEEVFGLGEQFSLWSLRGHRIPIISREQGIGRGRQPLTYILNRIPAGEPGYAGGDPLSTYTAIGHYITSRGRSVFLQNSDFALFDFTFTTFAAAAANSSLPPPIGGETTASIECVSRRMRLTVFHAQRPLQLIERYTRLYSGRMQPLPDWSMEGAVVGIQGGSQRVYQILDQLRNWGVPVSAVWYVLINFLH